MISGNYFPLNSHVWLQRKIKFSRNSFPVDQYLLLWPENDFTSHFHFKSFPKREREREREREKREPRSERERDEEETSPAIASLVDRWARSSDNRDCERARRWTSGTMDERCDCPTSALVDRATRRTIAPISPPPRNLIFSSAARSQFDQIWLIFLLGFVSSVNECGIDSLSAYLQLRKCMENWACKAFSVKMFEWTKHWN